MAEKLTRNAQAGGQIGEFITKELLKTGKHTITALTRQGSKSAVPDGVKVAPINYDDESTIVSALKGQQYLIITMSVMAPPDTQSKLIKAAAKAGVPHIMPNAFGLDTTNEKLIKENPLNGNVAATLAEIEAAGVSSWTSMTCNLWYEYSLVMGPTWFGFDFPAKKLTYYDDGTTKINLSTWEQCARAAAALLSLKELPDNAADKSPTVSAWNNKPLVISSFLVSQKDMFESWKRVSGDTDADWTFEHVASKDRYEQGMNGMKDTSDPLAWRMSAALASFVRLFFPNGGGDYESTIGLDNKALGLPEEDLDERTAVAKTMLEDNYAAKVMARLRG